MPPSASYPRCHGTKVEPHTLDLAFDEQVDCKECGGLGEIYYPKEEKETA